MHTCNEIWRFSFFHEGYLSLFLGDVVGLSLCHLEGENFKIFSNKVLSLDSLFDRIKLHFCGG